MDAIKRDPARDGYTAIPRRGYMPISPMRARLTDTPQELQPPQGRFRVALQTDHPQKFKPAAFILSEIFHLQHLAHFPKIALIAACDRLVMRGSLLSDAVRIALIQVVSFSVMGSPKISITAAAAVRPIACSKASRMR